MHHLLVINVPISESSYNADSIQFTGGINIEQSLGKELVSAFPERITSNNERQRDNGSTTTAAQGVEGISANKDILANATASDYRFNRNRTMQWFRSGRSSNSGGHGDASRTTSYEESCPETSSFSIRQQQEEFSTEEDSEDSAGSLDRKFLRCFGLDMDGEHL
ncbi:unnamed protein product [Spodoptera exigua]|nr:unnamed protein product [Spodoptera exigua]